MNVQRQFYNDLLTRCLELEGQKTVKSDLGGELQALSLEDSNAQDSSSPSDSTKQELLALQNIASLGPARSRNVSVLLQAMRKLREAIVATARYDGFAQSVYVFVVRATILLRHMESYHPALTLLLREIHPKAPLTTVLLREMQRYHVLDLACRQKDLNEAYRIRLSYGFQDGNIDCVLKAVAHGNWINFWKVKSRMCQYQQRLMEYASDSVRRHTVECLGKSFLRVDKGYIENVTQKPWQSLVKEYAIQWQAEGDIIVIRQMKRK